MTSTIHISASNKQALLVHWYKCIKRTSVLKHLVHQALFGIIRVNNRWLEINNRKASGAVDKEFREFTTIKEAAAACKREGKRGMSGVNGGYYNGYRSH